MSENKDVLKNYARIVRRGKRTISEDRVPEFGDFDPGLANRFNIALLFDPQSEALLQDRVVTGVQEAAQSLGLGLSLAGRNFPTHSTLIEGDFQGNDFTKRAEVFASLSADPRDDRVTQELVGLELNFKYLLLDGGNSILTAVDIPDEILKAREDLAGILGEQELKLRVPRHILHITVSRITKLPEEGRAEKLQEYARRIGALRKEVSANPLTLRVGAVSSQSAYSFLTSLAPPPLAEQA